MAKTKWSSQMQETEDFVYLTILHILQAFSLCLLSWICTFSVSILPPICLYQNLFLLSGRIFGTRCSKCCHLITQNDWIRRAGDQVFHLACFACDSCTRQLSTGEEFGLVEGRVLCKSHYLGTGDHYPNRYYIRYVWPLRFLLLFYILYYCPNRPHNSFSFNCPHINRPPPATPLINPKNPDNLFWLSASKMARIH
jgi:hypothetical protein